MGDERSRGVVTGTIDAHQSPGDGDRTRLAACRDGEPPELLDRATGAELRSKQNMGGQPFGSGRDSPTSGATTGAGRQDRGGDRTALSGAGGARQRRSLPTHGGSLRQLRPTVDHEASRRTVSGLARRTALDARTHRGRAGPLPQGLSTRHLARKTFEPNLGHRATSARRSGLAAAGEFEGAAQDRTSHRAVEPAPTTNRGARTPPC